jgi:hypothetical protein
VIVVLIALSDTDAQQWWAAQPYPPDVIVVTPRKPAAAHGRGAHAVLVTQAAHLLIPADVRVELLAGAMPCVATALPSGRLK